jgi:hypothetical protein
MAIPWLVVLQSVPWTDVVRNAPKLADGAKKLWNAIGKQSPVPERVVSSEPTAGLPEDQVIEKLQTRLAVLEAGTADLHEQMLASSELIKALADQNTQLIQRIEANRVRVLWLAGTVAIIGIIAMSGLALILVR